MSVSRYFGLPGCGKTTVLTMLAYRAVKSKRYKNVYANVHLKIPGVTYLPFSTFGKYEIREGIYFVDEATVNCGDRDYKNFGQHKIQYAMEHRHHFLDLVFFSQEADGMDKKLRSITDRCFYVAKGIITRPWITSVYRVPYKVLWPDGDTNGENAGRILMGYVKPPIWNRILAQRVFRPRWYKYFDSWECERLPDLPDKYQPYVAAKAATTACEPEAACGGADEADDS